MQKSVSEKCQIHLSHDIIPICFRNYYYCCSVFERFHPQQLKPQRTRSKNYFEWHLPAFVWENSFNHQSVFPKWSQAFFCSPRPASHKYLLESRVPCMNQTQAANCDKWNRSYGELIAHGEKKQKTKNVQTQARLGPTCPNNSAVKQISWSSKCSFLMQTRQCRALIYCWCSV